MRSKTSVISLIFDSENANFHEYNVNPMKKKVSLVYYI